MISILNKFFEFSGRQNKRKFYFSIVLGIISAFCHAIKIPAIYIIVRGVVEQNLQNSDVWKGTAILLGGLLLQIAVSAKSQMLQTEAGYDTGCQKRIEIASHLRYLPMGYFNSKSLGYITSVTTNMMENLCDVATRVVMITTKGILETLLITIMLLFFEWRIGLVAVFGIGIALIINLYMQKNAEKVSPKKLVADTSLIEQVLEYIQGITEAKSYNMTMENNQKLEKSIDKASKVCIDMEKTFIPIMGLQSWGLKMVSILMCMLSLYLGLNGQIDMPTTIVMLISSYMVFAALEAAGNYSSLLRVVDLSVERANEILSISEMDIRGENIVPQSRDIAMQNVDFSYQDKKVVDQVSLMIPEKTTAAFVGPSGGGKTTICHLLARFWDVDSGKVTFDGKDVREYDMDSLMQNFSFVFQNVYLFHDTIANNIRFGQPDMPMEKVMEAAKKARCHEFISALPSGYDTVIGEGGATLSGGEKQRISIARAMTKDAPVIILDEATANIDPENENELMQAITELTKEKTVIMIAHRLKTVQSVDQIIVIDSGKVVQKGRHEELMKEDGLYKKFVEERKKAASWKLGNKSQ